MKRICLLLALILLLAGCQPLNIQEPIQKPTGDEKSISAALDAVVNNPKTAYSSNPYDYTKDNKDFEYLIQEGDKTLEYCLAEFAKTKESGLKEYIMAIACSQLLDENPKDKSWSTGREWYDIYMKNKPMAVQGKLEEAYEAAFDLVMIQDPALNDSMQFIAIDGGTLSYLWPSQKQAVLDYFKKYDVKVMNASMEDLKRLGLYDKMNHSIPGILLRAKDVKIVSETKVTMEVSKYKSGLGAIGLGCTVEYKGGKWQVTDIGMRWIS